MPQWPRRVVSNRDASPAVKNLVLQSLSHIILDKVPKKPFAWPTIQLHRRVRRGTRRTAETSTHRFFVRLSLRSLRALR